VVVIEQATEPHPLPRAVHLDHEMMRLFQAAGVIDRLKPLMRATHGHVHIGADGGVIRYMASLGLPKRFGWSNDYFFYQPELEAELRAALARFSNVSVCLGMRLEAIIQGHDGARLEVVTEGASASFLARYVIACDGASSTTRKTLGVKLDDLDFEEPWLVVDAEVDGPISFPAVAGLPPEADLQHLSVMMCDPQRPATIVPGRGSHRRWEFMLLPGEDDQAMMQPEQVAALVGPWVRGSPHRIVRAATYRFHGLVAERWRVGRVFLAGDAAHQTPPFFGQGMCHGMRDVANLAWKLERVLRGQSNDALLDSYQIEREPHVRAVIGAAVAAGRYICLLDPDEAAKRDTSLREAAKGAAPATAADLIPPIRAGVVADDGSRFIQPKVKTADGGEQLLDDITGGGFVLLATQDLLADVTAAIEDQLNDLNVRRFAIDGPSGAFHDLEGHLAAWLQGRDASAVLVRPDAYVYGTAKTAEDVRRLADRLAVDLQVAALVGGELCTA
jgi:3-(3-hydroxy-phenyl)propionate hydroxylase